MKLINIVYFLRAVAMLLSLMTVSFLCAIIGFITWPIALIFDPQRSWQHKLTARAGNWAMRPFIKFTVKGRENVPAGRNDFIIVPNHQSVLDMGMGGCIGFLDFKVTYKRELLYQPGVGQALLMANYISVNRKDRSSGHAMLAKAADFLKRGIGVLIFAEGTRVADTADGPLGPFKAGAFKLACDTGKEILPVTISGARNLMSPKGLPMLRFGEIQVTIHRPISPVGKSVDQLIDETRRVLVTGLRPMDLANLEGKITMDAAAAGGAAAGAVENKKVN